MAVILQFFAQGSGEAHIARDDGWWVNAKLWSQRVHMESITRPTEDRALLNLWLEARALRHYENYRTVLTSVERRAKDLELEALRTPTLRGESLYQFVAKRMSRADDVWTWRRAQGILDDVSTILRQAELERVLELQAKAEKRRTAVFRDVVQEVIREGMAQVGRAA